MYLIMIVLFLLMVLVLLMMILNFLIMKKKMFNREKITPFECGFNPITSSRLPFSINFYLVMMIFLIFDVEIILFLPMIFSMMFLNKFWVYLFIYIMLILMVGIYMEWVENSIYWIF